MLKTFPIDFVRQTLEQKLFGEHLKDINLYGGKDQVSILSFYEQLKSQEQVDRFVETFRDLTEQQNRTGLIMNGVLTSPENPTITNLYSTLIVPMTWACSLRVMLENRDNAIVTLNNLINQLKGKKVDIAQLECVDENGNVYHDPFMVGTIGQNVDGLVLKDGDYIGETTNADLQAGINTLLTTLASKGVNTTNAKDHYFYLGYENKIKAVAYEEYHEKLTATLIGYDTSIIPLLGLTAIFTFDETYTEDDFAEIKADILFVYKDMDNVEHEVRLKNKQGRIDSISGNEITIYFAYGGPVMPFGSTFVSSTIEDYDIKVKKYKWDEIEQNEENIIVPPEHNSFEKYKLSMSFDAIRCDEPRNLNSNEYCELTFSGSATLVSDGVKLGNDLLKVSMEKYKIVAKNDITFTSAPKYWLEPLEMPSGNNANTQINQLVSNNFLTNTHTDAIALTLQYTFICDDKNDLLKQLFKYARYGTRGISVNDISPNMIFNVGEAWCSWGNFEYNVVKAKLVENVDIENTESDTLTIGITMQLQGDNN